MRVTRRVLAGAFLAALVGCATFSPDARHTPCGEPIEKDAGLEPAAEARASEEAAFARYVHLVTFEMGPFVETLQGYLVLRAPDALRLYGMTESGQRAFDVAWVSSGGVERVTRIYRAPFLRDDRLLDQIARATAKLFLLRGEPLGGDAGAGGPERVVEREGVRFYYGGQGHHLRWFEERDAAACFQDWRLVRVPGPAPVLFYAPTRVHYHSAGGPYPYDLTLKLLRAEALEKPPPDSLFEPK